MPVRWIQSGSAGLWEALRWTAERNHRTEGVQGSLDLFLLGGQGSWRTERGSQGTGAGGIVTERTEVQNRPAMVVCAHVGSERRDQAPS
jgi:hypothetical protein